MNSVRTLSRRDGFILRAVGSTRHFFSSCVRSDLQYVEDKNYAWFTEDRAVADQMASDLAAKTEQTFDVVDHSHEVYLPGVKVEGILADVTLIENDAVLVPTQRRALMSFIRQVTDRDVHVGTNPANRIAWTFELKGTDYGFAWVSVSCDVPTLAPGNALRVCTSIDNGWHVEIGRRGRLTAFTYPRSLAQFAGKNWCGIWIDGAQAAAQKLGRSS